MTSAPPSSTPSDGLQLAVTDQPDQGHVKALRDNLYRHNETAAGAYDTRQLGVFVTAEHGKLVGGLIGWTVWKWLYVDSIWLDPSFRGSSLGRSILEAAETEASQRGCVGVRLYTYDFQAYEFYVAQGYQVFGRLDDYPLGHTQYHLKKLLPVSPR